MKLVDVLLLIPIAVGLFFAVRHLIRAKNSGGCAGCSACGPQKDAQGQEASHNCPSHHMAEVLEKAAESHKA